ncbi:MAG: O-antigen ligase family protein [Candidatus Beckwithbacteria bacterium]
MRNFLNWLDKNLLTIMAGFFLVFIPLYPKWPMFDILPGYNVRVRLEDFLILFANLVLLIQVIRKKINLKKVPLLKPIFIYVIIGLLSTLSAIFITKTIYPEYIQVAKVFLHWFRRIEYFSLFFIFFFAFNPKKHLKPFLGLASLAVLGVSIYGFGQKYLYWPAYSTMNREFSKGIALYLTEHARVLSTFGGHFDLAAYIMLTLIPITVIGFLHPKKIVRFLCLFLGLAEYWIMILSASRTSWLAFMGGVSIAFLVLFKKKKFFWVLSRWLSVIVISTLIMLSFGELSERFSHILKLDGIKQTLLRPFRSPPKNGIAMRTDLTFEEQLSIVATNSDIPPSSTSPKLKKPADVYDNTYENLQQYLATTSGEIVNVDYSQNALKYGLSAGIRLDVLWPNAIKALKINPFLGTGYSTLVKSNVWEFTTAESTDNDYLRLLGETGILGFISFLAILFIVLKYIFKAFLVTKDPLHLALYAGAIGLTLGLMANAFYIDVFEASKVAYSFWSFIGIIISLAVYETKKS